MAVLGKILLGLLGAVVLAVVLAYSEGAVVVRVTAHQPAGENVNLFLPAAPLPLTLKLIPNTHFPQLPPEARAVLPALVEAAQHLETTPDFVLAEVERIGERVHIEKRGRKLIVEVESPDESVYVEIPLRTIAQVMSEVERAQSLLGEHRSHNCLWADSLLPCP
ncbi:MAG: hypothetical protein K6U09_11815 [Acidobacteriia bacterium]|jgi:hypothetical protein|nr:hypothetical protein [Terriglobia bacterium]